MIKHKLDQRPLKLNFVGINCSIVSFCLVSQYVLIGQENYDNIRIESALYISIQEYYISLIDIQTKLVKNIIASCLKKKESIFVFFGRYTRKKSSKYLEKYFTGEFPYDATQKRIKEKLWIMSRIRGCRFFRIFTVHFLLFLAPAGQLELLLYFSIQR